MNTTPLLRGAGLAVLTSLTALLAPMAPAGAVSAKTPVTGLITVSTTGGTGTIGTIDSDVSGFGRFVAVGSAAANLVPGDTNAKSDVFVRNTLSETTTRVSVSTAGAQANGDSSDPSISYDGRWVVFTSTATNLVPGDTNAVSDIFLRDLKLKTTVRVNLTDSGAGQVTGGSSYHPQVSSNGNEILFTSEASNVVSFDLNAKPDVFVRNISGNYTEIESVTTGGAPITAGAQDPAFSSGGRYVVFGSQTNQIGLDTNGKSDIFLRDRLNHTTEKVSTASNGDQSDGDSQFSDVSDNGRYVTFGSKATDLTPAVDAPAFIDVFRRDRQVATTELVTRNGSTQPGNKGGTGVKMSADGNLVAFASTSTNLVGGDTNGLEDTFIRNLSGGTTTRTSVKTSGGQLTHGSFAATLSSDGSASSFTTSSNELYDHDTNGGFDIFVRGNNELGPFVNTLSLVQRNATDFSAVPPTLGQAVAMNDRILYGVASPESTIDDLAHGTFDNGRGPVMRLYWAFFHRMPDLNGLNFWVKKYDGGMTLKAVANEFAKSSEFTTKYGTVSNDAFITLVYQNVLERSPDAAGKAHWVGRLGDGVTRGEMMTAFSESSEGIRKMRGEIDTILLFIAMLHRLPTQAEFGSDVTLLETAPGQDTEVLVNKILTSATYAAFIAK